MSSYYNQNCVHSKYVVGILLSLSFVLSALSDLDCEFTLVDVGFSPENTEYNMDGGIIGFGLWTLEDLDSDGFCLMPVFLIGNDSLTYDDDMYNTFFTGNDAVFSSVRILSLIGALIALVNLVLSWSSLFSVLESEKTTTLIILYMTILSFICEGVKIGLMFVSPPCVAADFWERNDKDSTSKHKADQCFIGRGCYMSIVATIFYFCAIVHIIVSLFFAVPTPDEEEAMAAFDELSMPSYLNSIGESTSVVSKFSSSQGSFLSRARSTGSHNSGSGQSSAFLSRASHNSSSGQSSANCRSRTRGSGSGSGSGSSSSGARRSTRSRRRRRSSVSGYRSGDQLPMIGEETGQSQVSGSNVHEYGKDEYEYFDQ